MRHWMIPLALLTGAAPLALQAQDCTLGHLPDSSNEAEIFRIRGVSTVFARAAAPRAFRPHAIQATMEFTTLPDIDAATRTPTTCNPGKPPENTNILPVMPRPRVTLGLADEFALELSWVPPVTISGVKANLIGVALARTVPAAAGVISLRAHATLGEIRAPITCTEDQIAVDTLSPDASQCAGGADPSNDHFKPNSYGFDVAYSWASAGGRIRPYLGGGVNFLRSRFQVEFTDFHNNHLDQKIEGNYTRPAVFGGATWLPSSRLGLTAELYTDPGTAWVGRVGMGYGLK